MCSKLKQVVKEVFKLKEEGFCYVFLWFFAFMQSTELFELLRLFWACLFLGTPESLDRFWKAWGTVCVCGGL